MNKTCCFNVRNQEDGVRLDVFLGKQCPDYSRSFLQKCIKQGSVQIDGTVCRRPKQTLRGNQNVAIALSVPKSTELVSRKMPLEILYEDEDLIVINKPPGIVVHPAPGHEDNTLVNGLIDHCGEAFREVGEDRLRPGIVHRLDKDTSGVMVVAKNAFSYDALSQAFASREIERVYNAFCWGVPLPLEGEYEGDIGRDPRHRKRMAIVPQGKKALTTYKVQEIFTPFAAWVNCRLHTGRTHQIRVHFASHGHPLVGDPLYLRRTPAYAKKLPQTLKNAVLQFPRQALHAATLGFKHPRSGERMFFRTAWPDDMKALYQLLASK